MASPQPDEFTRISNELYTAIMQSDFSKRQRNMIDLVIRMSYGCGKKSALLRPVDFEVVGVHKSDVRHELEYLAAAKVLFVNGENIALNKDYDQWRISLVKAARDKKRFEEILARNLRGDNPVGKTPTNDEEPVGEIPTGVGKTPTEVGKLPTNKEEGGWQNTNSPVGKIPTEGTFEPNGDKGSQPRKESSKEISYYADDNNARARVKQDLYQNFLAEFGRPLSPTEIEKIQSWEQEMPAELIAEALRRAVLNGKFSFKYIDSILLNWQKKNIRTLLDVQRQDEEYQNSKSKQERAGPAKKAKEDDQYAKIGNARPEDFL